MKLLKRISITAAITLGVIALGVFWIAPVALSFHAARTASPVARMVPADLTDLSVSQTPRNKLSYVGYEFEIPWDDCDESQTKFVPKDDPFMVSLVFRSGRRLIVSASPARVFPDGFARDWKVSPQSLESIFGNQAMQSDYNFLKSLYQFTPDNMHYWALSPDIHYRESFLLSIKSAALSKSAETGIFNIQHHGYRGFQQGDPSRPGRIIVKLFSDQGSIELFLSGKDAQSDAGITQPEINRLVQSVRKVVQNQPKTAPQIAKN